MNGGIGLYFPTTSVLARVMTVPAKAASWYGADIVIFPGLDRAFLNLN